jgi:hypothetical protein
MMLYKYPDAPAETWVERFADRVEQTLHSGFGVRALLFCLLAYAACVGVLLQPGVFFVSYLLNDTFIYSEAGYRLASGQLPGLGSTSALGIFTFTPYALAFRVFGDAVQAIPQSFAIFAGILVLLGAVIALTRLSAVIGVGVVVVCALVMLSPFVIGYDVPGEIMSTAANTYNRFGFLLLLLAALLAIEPRSPRSFIVRVVDIVWAVTATMLAYYTKMPFGLGVAGLVGFCLLFMRKDPISCIAVAVGCALIAVGVEKLWPGLNAAYIHEMTFASTATGGTLRPWAVAMMTIHAAPEFLAFAALPLAAMYFANNADWRDGVLAALIFCGPVLLLSQSAQGMVLVTPVAIAIIAATRLAAAAPSPARRVAMWASLIAAIAGLTSLAVPAALAIGRHTVAAIHASPIAGMPYSYRSLRVIDDGDIAAMDAAMTGSSDSIRTYIASHTRVNRLSRDPLFENEYAHTIAKLAPAREVCGSERDRTAILDFANVSSSLFGHPPAGTWAYLHFGRSFSAEAYVPPARLFAGAGCLFDPKLPQFPETHAAIWTVYGEYLRTHYRVAGETPFWRVLVATPATDPPHS